MLRGVWKVLKSGGELHFSDVYCDRRLPAQVREDELLVGECIGGALYIEDFRRLCHDIGFKDVRMTTAPAPIAITDAQLKHKVGNAKFYSITYRCFKHEHMEDRCEDYGQVAIYKGTIAGHEHVYDLDDHHRLFAHKPMLVCANTALMLQQSWLQPHFTLIGDTRSNPHFGLFDCTTPASNISSSASAANDNSNAACGPNTACC